MDNVYHYLTQAAFADAHRRGSLAARRSPIGPLLFAPDTDWAPTFFRERSPGQLRAASRQEMLASGLYRFGIPVRELTLVSQLDAKSVGTLEPQLDALAEIGLEPLGWRVLIEACSTFDVVSDRFIRAGWRRITTLKRTAGGLQVLDDVPVLPFAAPHRLQR